MTFTADDLAPIQGERQKDNYLAEVHTNFFISPLETKVIAHVHTELDRIPGDFEVPNQPALLEFYLPGPSKTIKFMCTFTPWAGGTATDMLLKIIERWNYPGYPQPLLDFPIVDVWGSSSPIIVSHTITQAEAFIQMTNLDANTTLQGTFKTLIGVLSDVKI